MNQITTQNTINAAIAEVEADLLAKQKPPTAAELMLQKSNEKMERVTTEFIGKHKLLQATPDMPAAIEELFSAIRDEFHEWDKDDLLSFLSYVLAQALANELRQRGRL